MRPSRSSVPASMPPSSPSVTLATASFACPSTTASRSSSIDAMALIEELREAVVDGQAKLAVAKVTEGLEGGIEAGTLLREGLIQGMAQGGKPYAGGGGF